MGGIIVGVDGSEHSLDALRWAADEAKLRNQPLTVLGTFTTPIQGTAFFEVATADPTDLQAASETMLGAAIDIVRTSGHLDGVEVTTEVDEGHASERLVTLSKDADLLVVGSRGHGGFMGLLLGSTTTHVVNHAECPVVVVRHDKDEH